MALWSKAAVSHIVIVINWTPMSGEFWWSQSLFNLELCFHRRRIKMISVLIGGRHRHILLMYICLTDEVLKNSRIGSSLVSIKTRQNTHAWLWVKNVSCCYRICTLLFLIIFGNSKEWLQICINTALNHFEIEMKLYNLYLHSSTNLPTENMYDPPSIFWMQLTSNP